LGEAAIFLAAAVVAVPLFRRFRLGAVLGYLAAGVAIGPFGLRFVSAVDNVMHFAELGVVLLLFVIGLELQPSRLWVLRRSVFGLGSAQVLLTGLVVGAIAMAVGLEFNVALVVGLGLAMSSTAFVLQILAEKGQLGKRHGRSSFAILLFQDLAVIPLLALIPMLGTGAAHATGVGAWLAALKAIVVIVAVIAGGRYLLRPVLKAIADSGIQEIFTAASLLVVIGTSLLMASVGLSMSLGAFLAGVLLADSEYRHELEANIEPFKGLLLGLFFISVGMSADLALLVSHPFAIIGATIGLMVIKAAVLLAIGRVSGHSWESSRGLAAALCQGGEFAFVLFGLAADNGIMDHTLADSLVIVVTASMALTPLVFAFNDTLLAKWLAKPKEEKFDTIDAHDRVIIAGFGRVGQIVGRLLRAKRIPFTALDKSSEQVETVRRFGSRPYYGDASRLDMLRAAGAEKAEILVLAIDDVEASIRTADNARKHFPKLKIYARARNRFHAYRLMDIGVDYLMRETFVSSLELAQNVMQGLGLAHWEARDAAETFRRHDEGQLESQHAIYHDETQLIQTSKDALKELEGIFDNDMYSTTSSAVSPPTFSPSDIL
jgi:glutathione-regulated potassium-efflux system ancillary protein KefC/glutathione-regulated potassium-efflux system protein KefB